MSSCVYTHTDTHTHTHLLVAILGKPGLAAERGLATQVVHLVQIGNYAVYTFNIIHPLSDG